MRYLASVTFETWINAPETVKVEIVAASHQKAASVAMREAKKKLPNRRPKSIVVVLELEQESETDNPEKPASDLTAVLS